MTAFRKIIGGLIPLIALFLISPFAFAQQDQVYHVAYYSQDKNAEFVQSQLDAWAAEDLGPVRYDGLFLGSRYFYFKLDQELVLDLFTDLSEQGDIFVEKRPTVKSVEKGKVQIVIWFFQDRGLPAPDGRMRIFQASSEPNQVVKDLKTKLSEFKFPFEKSQGWKSSLSGQVPQDNFSQLLNLPNLKESVILAEDSKKSQGNTNQVPLVVSVLEINPSDSVGSTDKKTVKADLILDLVPAYLFSSETEDVENELRKIEPQLTIVDSDTHTGFSFKVPAAKIFELIDVLTQFGLVRNRPQADFSNESQVSVLVQIQKQDEVMAQMIDMDIENIQDLSKDRFRSELDILYSAGFASSSITNSVDLTARQWFGKYGIRAQYVDNLGASYNNYAQLIGVLLQYRYRWSNAKYGQSIVPGIVYKQIKTSGPTGAFYGIGVAYTDDLWSPLQRIINLIPFLRKPKTLEINLEYLPFTTIQDVAKAQALILSLKGYIYYSPKINMILAFYGHNYQFERSESTAGVQTALSKVTHAALAAEFGVGFRF